MRLKTQALGLLAAMASIAPWSVRAMNWEVTPRVSVSETFTDNVNLRPEGEAGLVTRFRPGVDILGQGARTRAHLMYTLDGIIALSDSGTTTGGRGRNRSRLFHRLVADGNMELLKRHLFIDARARRRQFATTLAGPIGIDTTAGFTNLTAVTALSVSPYLTNHFRSYADSTLRYSHDRVFVEGNGIADSKTNQVSGTLESGDAFGPFSWSLNASHTRTERASGLGGSGAFTGAGIGAGVGGPGRFGSGTFNEASVRLGLQLTRHFAVSATGGYQDNDFQSFRNSIDGPFWDVGINWAPNQRTSLEAHYGKRFFGNTGSLDLRYRRRAVLLQANFSQRVSSLRNVILADAGTIASSDICPPSNPTCVPFDEIAVLRPEAVQDFFLLRRGNASITLFSAKHSATLAYVLLRRTIERTGDQSGQQGVTLRWSWRLKANTRFIASGGYRRIEPLRVITGGGGENTFWHTSLMLAYDLAPSTSAQIAYRHQSRDSSRGTFGYDENALTVGISTGF